MRAVIEEYERKPDRRIVPNKFIQTYQSVLNNFGPKGYEELIQRLIQPIDSFDGEGITRVSLQDGRCYYFKDNGSNILAVAHLDSVAEPGTPKLEYYNGMHAVRSRTVDDRVGVYIILDVLPKFGVKYDWLLTTGEEQCRSSAYEFKVPEGKVYNWMFQFDRAGTDWVGYQYETDEIEAIMKEYDLPNGIGSYSDIRELERLGCAGFNIGTAYYNNHQENAVVVMAEMLAQVARFIHFYNDHKDRHFKYTPSTSYGGRWNWRATTYDDWSGWDDLRSYGSSYKTSVRRSDVWESNWRNSSSVSVDHERMDVQCTCGSKILDLKKYTITYCQKCKVGYLRHEGWRVFELRTDKIGCEHKEPKKPIFTTSWKGNKVRVYYECWLCHQKVKQKLVSLDRIETFKNVNGLRSATRCVVCKEYIRARPCLTSPVVMNFYGLNNRSDICSKCHDSAWDKWNFECVDCGRLHPLTKFTFRWDMANSVYERFHLKRGVLVCNDCVELYEECFAVEFDQKKEDIVQGEQNEAN